MMRTSSHRPWTDAELEQLRAYIASGGSAPRASIVFKRSEQAVRAQAAKLGLKFITIRELRRRAGGEPAAAAT